MLDDFHRRTGSRTKLLRRCCRRLVRDLFLRTLPALTAHLVGVPTVITHHLKALIWNVLRDRCDKIARAERLKVALDLRIHSRAIENRVAQAIHLHLRNRKRIANNVLREALDVLTLIRRDATALVYFESRMHPPAQHARSINGQQSGLDQERNHARTEQLLQRRVIARKNASVVPRCS